MVLEISIEKILTPEIESMLKQHQLTAVGAALIVETAIPADEYPKVHVVKSGETLYKIAKMHGISLAKLIELNGIKTPNLINVGQILKLE